MPHTAVFFFNDTATTEIYTLSLHDALPISKSQPSKRRRSGSWLDGRTPSSTGAPRPGAGPRRRDRKSTRLNSSHLVISYAVFCLKKKKKTDRTAPARKRTISLHETHLAHAR